MRNFLDKLRYNLQRFMYGRYGVDNFYRFITIIIYVLLIIGFVSRKISFTLAALLLLIINTMRCFSKNINRRQRENQKYLNIKNTITSFFKLQVRKIKEKDYTFKKCPHCKQTLRLPKKKGKHTVNCPKCHKDFEIRI